MMFLCAHSSLISPLLLSMVHANPRSGFYGKMEQFGLLVTKRRTLSHPGFMQSHAARWELLISMSRKVLFSMWGFVGARVLNHMIGTEWRRFSRVTWENHKGGIPASYRSWMIRITSLLGLSQTQLLYATNRTQ